MSMVKKDIVWKVTLVNGQKREHIYAIPTKVAEAEAFAEFMTKTISRAMVNKDIPLMFTNPLSFYNPEHVISIDFEVDNVHIDPQVITAFQKPPMGFKR